MKFILELAMKAQRGSKSLALLFNLPLCYKGWVVNATLRPHYPLEWPDTHCTIRWMGLTAGLENVEISPPTGIPGPSRP